MADNETSLSLLDRLIDENPSRETEERLPARDERKKVRDGLQRDISNLLSTRSWLGTWPRELSHLKTSILNYGLPDVTGVAIGSDDVQQVMRVTVQMSLQVFEPRLTDVDVFVMTEPQSRTAQLAIQAGVRGDHEPIVLGGGLAQSSLTDMSKGGR